MMPELPLAMPLAPLKVIEESGLVLAEMGAGVVAE